MKHDFARKLRRDQTEVERRLWNALRGRRCLGFKFRRQQSIGPYIVDFISFEAKLVIELDGDQHGADDAVAYDTARTARLSRDGFHVLRFANHEIHRDFDRVLDVIARSLEER